MKSNGKIVQPTPEEVLAMQMQAAQQQQQVFANRFCMDVAGKIYANEVVKHSDLLDADAPMDAEKRPRLQAIALAARETALILAEVYGIQKLKEIPTSN